MQLETIFLVFSRIYPCPLDTICGVPVNRDNCSFTSNGNV